MSTTFANFLFEINNEEHGLLNVGPDDKPLYANMATFLLMGDLLQRVSRVGINPDIDISPEYIGFRTDDVHKYGYFLLFVINLPLYAEAVWNPETADYRQLIPQEERRKIDRLAAFENEENEQEEETEEDDDEDEEEGKKKKKKKKKPASLAFRHIEDY